MTYDYMSINFTSVTGFIFLLIFLYANATLDRKIKRTFYILLFIDFIEMLTYSLELWTTTFETLHPIRLWLSAIGYSVRPIILWLILTLAMRHITPPRFPHLLFLPAGINIITSFSVFFTDIVYSYTLDNQFQRGPLGYFTYVIIVLYLLILTTVVIRSHADRPKLESLIIFALCLLLLFGWAAEAVFAIRTLNRTTLMMATIFYYMFFQTQTHNASLSKEHSIRMQLEYANRIDGSTGVLNKTAFTQAATDLLSAQNPSPLSSVGLVFLDLDHLKELNDTLGHAMGDVAIANTATTIQELCRKTDLIGRFGGDEFYIMLPNITKQRFQIYLNEAQARLQREYSSGSLSITVSASIGAVYTENLSDMRYELLVQTADEAVYEAKAAGRNCHILKEL